MEQVEEEVVVNENNRDEYCFCDDGGDGLEWGGFLVGGVCLEIPARPVLK